MAKLLQSQSFAPLEKMNGFSLQRDAGKGLERSCIFYNTISQHFRKRGQTSSQISDPGGCRQQHEPVQVAGLTKRAFLFVLLKLCLISFSIFLNSTYSDWFSMGSVGNVAMGGTRVVSGVASLSDRALQLMKETLIFSSPTKPPTCRPMDVKPSQLRFSPAPIQQKGTNKCNSWSGANVIKPAGPQMQEWEHGTGRTDSNSLEVFPGHSELRSEAELLPFPNTERLGPALPGLCLMQSCLGKSEVAGAMGSELYWGLLERVPLKPGTSARAG